MKLWCIALSVAILTMACGGSSAPSSPSTSTPPATPAAQIQTTGQSQWVDCLQPIGGFQGSCVFQGSGQNIGVGCAQAVRGVVTFYAGTRQVGSTYEWALGSTRIVRPNEQFAYRTLSLYPDPAITTYTSSPSWTNVRCQ